MPTDGVRKVVEACSIREIEARSVQDLEPSVPYTKEHGIPVNSFITVCTGQLSISSVL